jgi:hypothetical protein
MIGHSLGIGIPPLRYPGHSFGLRHLGHLLKHEAGCDDALTDRVDADALALQVHSPIAGERAERRFGGTIDAEGRATG